ncbi:MAG: hypothetical protein ABFE13_11565 [Phycisphaerales bacterium]
MGIGEQLNAAALKQENMGLRAELARARGMLRAISAQNQAMEMEVKFIAAALNRFVIWPEENVLAAISAGRLAARLYIEQLSAEAENERAEAEVSAPEGGLVVVPGTGDEN